MQQVWDASAYSRHGRFVAELAEPLVEVLDPKPGERVLDLGCGDGFLTMRIAESGASVVGIDSSPPMVAAARARGVQAYCARAEMRVFEETFDAVFSNATLHWIRDQDAVLENVRNVLKPGGRFVAELGGHGNIAAIRVALMAVLRSHDMAPEVVESNYFFTIEEYQGLLEKHGFAVERITLVPRPTPLASGIPGWLETFRAGLLDRLPPDVRAQAVEEIVVLLKPVLCDRKGNWTADYVRLRFVARRI
jgi:trans-aconitate methyltransferase